MAKVLSESSVHDEAPPASEVGRAATPPSAEELRETDVPSARPTAVPDYDVTAIAAVAFRDDRAQIPLDISIPVLTQHPPRSGFSLRAAFLFLHVDGHSSIAQIAEIAQLSVGDAIACFNELVAAGAVNLTGTPLPKAVPQSGVKRKDD